MQSPRPVLLIGAGPSLRGLLDVAAGEFAVVEADWGDDAEARLRARPFDLVLVESASAERAVEQVKALRAVRADAKLIVAGSRPTA